MSLEQNKQLVMRWINEVVNRQDVTGVEQFYAPNSVYHFVPTDPSEQGQIPGPEGERRFEAAYYAAFPDNHFQVEQIVAEGDLVMIRYVYSGTHRGNFMGFAPTGKSFKAAGMDLFRIVNGKFVEKWMSMNTLEVLQQLGLLAVG